MEQTGQGQRTLLIIDHQVGLAQVVRDYNTNDLRNNILGHAALGNVLSLPTVLTTSSDAGPNGLMLKEITDIHPNATFAHRQGEVNAWDNADFRSAVEATGKEQLIVAGIVTEDCMSFLALSLVGADTKSSPIPMRAGSSMLGLLRMRIFVWRGLVLRSWVCLVLSMALCAIGRRRLVSLRFCLSLIGKLLRLGI